MSLDSEKLRFNPVENVLLEKNGDRTEKLFLQDGVLLSEETDESMYDIAYELEFVPYNYSPESSSSASQVLREFYKSSDWYQEVSATDNSMYELVDIDQDGMPELVIRTGDSQQVQYYIYSYEKDTAHHLRMDLTLCLHYFIPHLGKHCQLMAERRMLIGICFMNWMITVKYL